MSDSQTKQSIIDAHKANVLLQAPILAPMKRQVGVDLSVDQPTMKLDPAILEKAAVALEEGNTHYVDVPGIAPLRQVFADYLADMGASHVKSANILVTAGIQEGRFLTMQKIGEGFGAIGLPAVVHPGAKLALGVRPLTVHTLPVDAETLLPTLDGIESAMRDGCRLFYLESPARLSGVAFDRQTVQQLAHLVAENDAAVIWDQGLCPWVENEYVSLGSQPEMADRVALIGEAWPGVGLESWSIGYISANVGWIEPMQSQKQIQAICTTTPSQFAALKAAELYPDLHAQQAETLSKARDQFLKSAERMELDLISSSVNHLVVLRKSDRVNSARLEQVGYKFADGADFGAPDVLRFLISADGAALDALACAVQ